jgi:predicted aspartyl protease
LSRLFGGPHFLVSTTLCSQGLGVRLHSLVDTGAQGFLFLNSNIAHSISQALRTPLRKLPFRVQVKGFQDQITSPVTQYLRLHMIIDGRKVRNCPFIVVDLGSQDCIIGIKWLKRFKLKLDTERSRLIWPEKYPRSYDPAPPLLMRLQQNTPQDTVMLDVQRRD